MAVLRPSRVVKHRATGLAAVGLAALLAFLAVLQYRWIGEVSEAERERLRTAPTGFVEAFDRELTRVWWNFQPGPSGMGGPGNLPGETDRRTALLQQARRWRSQAPLPQLVRDVYVAEPGSDARLALSRLDLAAGRFVPAPWPAELLPLSRRLASAKGPILPLDGEAVALLLPLDRPRDGAPGPPGGAEGIGGGRVIVQLDRRFIASEFLPELAEGWFGVSNGPQVLLAVVGPQGIVYRSDPSLPSARFLHGDQTLPLFGLRRLEGPHGPAPGPFPGNAPPPRPPRPGRPGRHRTVASDPWKLVVTHGAGSLEAAVARARLKNLAVSFGVLALLAASFTVTVLSAQRARDLARQQLELVAGITHELNTPLAAIRSAGQNLADGVVAEKAQVRRYGALIEREGARLTGMVGKALELAGIQSGQRAYRPEPVPVAEMVEEVLEDARFALEERGIRVERHIPEDLPWIQVDRAALRMALGNLVDNAVKYAADGHFIAIRAAAERSGRQVGLTVEDRGPGIPPEDRPHLFEPFYRGHAVAAGAVHGSGLGLSLVRRIALAHRGTVSVAAAPGGKGSAFTLHLPAALRTPEGLEAREDRGDREPGELGRPGEVGGVS